TPERRRDDQQGRSPTARSVAKAGGRADRPHRRRTPEDGRAPRRGRPTGRADRGGKRERPRPIAMPDIVRLVLSAASACSSYPLPGVGPGWWIVGLGLSPMPDCLEFVAGGLEAALNRTGQCDDLSVTRPEALARTCRCLPDDRY